MKIVNLNHQKFIEIAKNNFIRGAPCIMKAFLNRIYIWLALQKISYKLSKNKSCGSLIEVT